MGSHGNLIEDLQEYRVSIIQFILQLDQITAMSLDYTPCRVSHFPLEETPMLRL